MAGRIPQSFVDDLLARVDIVEIIDRYVPLKKAGANHKACCPFHGEKTPSFNVSQAKQFYHCFGCGVSGTAISFLMEFDHMHFVDAVEYLADSVGLEVPRDAIVKITPSQQGLFDALGHCSDFFQQELRKNTPAIDYLKQRKISGETALEFQIGYSPAQWHALAGALNDSEANLITTGMLIRNDSGKTHDRFRNRIMFPIRDRRGRAIGFGGRVMDNTEPKYLNSPETPLFQKGRELYGLYELRKHKRATADRVIVVEGYMDVIALAQAGIKNAVATLGTATSKEQVASLFRETDEIVFCFDGDTAGKKAAWRALNSALPSLKSGRDARFLFLADGEDPDSVVNTNGREYFQNLITNSAIEASAFMFQSLEKQAQKGTDNTGTGHRARLAELAKPLISQIPEGVYRDLLSAQLTEKVGLQVIPPAAPATPTPRPNTGQQNSMKPTPVRRALTGILAEPACILEIDPEEIDFSDKIPGTDLLMQVIALIEVKPDITTAGILEHFREKPEWTSLKKLAEANLSTSAETGIDSPLSIVKHAIKRLNDETRMINLRGESSELNKLPSAMTDAEKEELRRKISELKKP